MSISTGLQELAISHVLDTVCCMNVTNMSSWQGEEKAAFLECYMNGWLHADVISANDVDEQVGYVFASPLHRWYIERRIHVNDYGTPHVNVLEFSREVIRLYNPNSRGNKDTSIPQ